MTKSSRIDIASIRKEQIVEAAVAVIAEQGLPNLSLSEIEKRAFMSRGQLTYYFPTKEAILLAVFDRLLQLMYQSVRGANDDLQPPNHNPGACSSSAPCPVGGWELVRHLLTVVIGGPPRSPEFHALQYTFLSQIGYREDFRQRLATLYGEWRDGMAAALAEDQARGRARPAPPRALATLIQALLHGLAMQSAADPGAFDRQEMLRLCLDVLGSYLGVAPANGAPANGTSAAEPPARA
jgi:AcrR family transcriptional regulator